MAKKAKNIDIPEGFIDYYVLYGIDRKTKTKDIRKLLFQKQGEIRSNMSNGALNSPEIMKKLQEAGNEIANAIKAFKNDERRSAYDEILDAAYAAGRIDTAAQTMAQDLYEEIEALFMKGNYRLAVQKCMDALNNNVRDYRIYILLAQSYFALSDPDRSIKTVDDGLKVHPDNLPLLRAGARFANEGKKDYDKAQGYVNRMLEIDKDSPLAASEQSYLYLTTGKQDLAYGMIDEYVEKHPNDMEFRKDVAYDLVGYSYSCYTKDPNSDAYVIASQEDYQRSLDTCNKAMSLYNDENVREALENAKSFGTVEFNDENRDGIKWLFIGGLIYAFAAVMAIMAGAQAGELGGAIVGSLPFTILGGLLLYSAVRLRQVSYRPYWQINKFILTGQREKGEKKYIIIGKIFAGYMRWSFKIGWAIVKFAFSLAFH